MNANALDWEWSSILSGEATVGCVYNFQNGGSCKSGVFYSNFWVGNVFLHDKLFDITGNVQF